MLPFNFSQAITQNHIDAEVQIVCTDGNDNWFSGSGTLIDSRGIVLTNKHVVTDLNGNLIKYCAVGLTESIDSPPNFKFIAETRYVAQDLDVAILYIDNKNNEVLPYVNVFNYDTSNLKFGDGIEVLGYPSIGGNTLTYVNGVFGGYYGDYIKTTAPLEYGNSGGSAYTFNGDFIGIPTAVVKGELNSISYILDVNKIKDWLSSLLGNNFTDSIKKIENSTISSTINTNKDITPPNATNVWINICLESACDSTLNQDSSYDMIYPSFKWQGFKDESSVVGYFVYFGKDFNAEPAISGTFKSDNHYYQTMPLEDPGVYYLKIQAKDSNGNISNSVHYTYRFNTSDNSGSINYGESSGAKALESRPTKFYIFDYSNGYKGELLKTIYLNSIEIQRFDLPTNNVLIEWDTTKNKGFITNEEVKLREDANRSKVLNLDLSGDNYIAIKNLSVNSKYNFSFTGYWDNNGKKERAYFFNIFEFIPTNFKEYKKSNFGSTLAGQIVLQVEQNGEAHYIYPIDNKRYYLGRPDDAFQVMRELGLGATHDFISGYTYYPNHVVGKILIDVEKNGEAYYIYPKDKKAYFLGRPTDAFQIMRDLGLGITNNDLNKIPMGNL